MFFFIITIAVEIAEPFLKILIFSQSDDWIIIKLLKIR